MAPALTCLPLPVRIQFSNRLSPVVTESGPLRARVEDRLGRELEALVSALGIQGQIELSFRSAPPTVRGGEPLLQVFLHGRGCPCRLDLLSRVGSWVEGRPLARGRDAAGWSEWLNEPAGAVDLRAEFIVQLCLEAIRIQPGLLLDEKLTEACLAECRASVHEPEAVKWPPARWFLPAFRQVLNVGVSLDNRRMVGEICRDAIALELDQETLAERLIEALGTGVVELRTTGEFLRELTIQTGELELIPVLRDVLFNEEGSLFPPFRFVRDQSLPPNSLAVKVNHLVHLPWRILDFGTCLMVATPPQNLEPSDLAVGMAATPALVALNPANLMDCTIIGAERRASVEAAGTTVWGQVGYALLCLAAELRAAAPRCWDAGSTRSALTQLERVYPELVQCVQRRYTVEQLTGVLRALLEEAISIRNLRGLLEALLDFDPVAADTMQLVVLGDRLTVPTSLPASRRASVANLASSIRIHLRRSLSHWAKAGRDTLLLFTLDPQIESMLAAASVALPPEDMLRPEDELRLRQAIRSKIESTLAGDQCGILTTAELRPVLARLVHAEHPRMRVIAYQELTAETRTQRVGCITLEPQSSESL